MKFDGESQELSASARRSVGAACLLHNKIKGGGRQRERSRFADDAPATSSL